MNYHNQAEKYGKSEKEFRDEIPGFGFMRLRQIIGDSKADPPVTPIIPVCASTWWNKVKTGEYPQPVKLSENITAWRAADIRDLIKSFERSDI